MICGCVKQLLAVNVVLQPHSTVLNRLFVVINVTVKSINVNYSPSKLFVMGIMSLLFL